MSLAFILIIMYSSCDINEPDNKEYSKAVDENGITLLVKNNNVSSEGKFKIINNSDRVIYVPYLHFGYCSFILYSLEQKDGDNWNSLYYDAEKNKWIAPNGKDSIIAICDIYKRPVVLKPNQSIEQAILETEQNGEFRLNISYRYSEYYNQNSPNQKIKILYIVKK